MIKRVMVFFILSFTIIFWGCASSSKSAPVKSMNSQQQLDELKKQAEADEDILHKLRQEDRALDKELKTP